MFIKKQFQKTISSFTGDSANPVQLAASDLVKNLADTDALVLEGLGGTSISYDTCDSFAITDLQVGDGLGNDTGNLYVLVREYTSYLSRESSTNPSSDNIFSRGALVKIDASKDCTPYGWSNSPFELPIDEEGTTKDTYYTPSESSTTEFFGPVKFCAVAPKKLVVLDDGFIWSTSVTEKNLKNRDSIFEFDIESVTLSKKGAAIDVSVPDTSVGYYYDDKTAW